MVLRVVQIYRGENGGTMIQRWSASGYFFVFIDIRRQRLGFVAKKNMFLINHETGCF